jgi:hypothetical protein
MDKQTLKPKLVWSRLGGQLGVGLCALGFLLVFLGWNGAASVDRIPSQFPYLLSGGVAGLCFVILGVGMLVVQNQRADRAALQATLRELQESLERAGLAQGAGERRKPFARPAPRLTAAKPTRDAETSTAEAPQANARKDLHGGADDIDQTQAIATPTVRRRRSKAAST